jgi:hypothetical protein
MQKRRIVPHFLGPTNQPTPAALRPAVRALHHPPPRAESGFLLQGSDRFPPRSNLGGEAELGEQSTVRVSVGNFL